MRSNLSILSGKLAKNASQIIGKNGTNIPGVVARKIDRNLLKKLSHQVDKTILITGTNGKTTTANLLANILQNTGKKVLHNTEGANLITGITATYLNEASLMGKLKYDYAVIEVDELTLPRIVKEINPDMVVVTNFFRDQLDRMGEIDILINKMMEALKGTDTKLILNGDDPFVFRLSALKKDNIFFGLHKDAFEFVQHEMSESKFCPRPKCIKKKRELKYSHVHYSQLGYYRCKCGFKRPKMKYEVTKINNEEVLSFNLNKTKYKMGISGVFNVYNALPSVVIAKELGMTDEQINNGLLGYQAENGRMQKFIIKDKPSYLNLVKNPAGVNTTISEVLYKEDVEQLVFFLNDLEYDGLDVSWIWDADYERVVNDKIKKIVCSGTRAYDMAVRLKYAGVKEENIQVFEDKQEAINYAVSNEKETYYIPNYTALDPVRKYLEKRSEES